MLRIGFFLVAMLAQSARGADFTFNMEDYGFIEFEDTAPKWGLGIDLRPEIDLKFGEEKWRLLARPRFRGWANWSSGVANVTSRWQCDDCYLSFTPSDSLNLTAGIINFQWGPSELLSPSNPLYHLNPDQLSLLFRQEGLVLARANYSFSQNLVLSLLAEPVYYIEHQWISTGETSPRGLAKLEYRFGSSANYIGVTTGMMETRLVFFGQYASWYLSDALSIYFDARESLGSPATYPSGGSQADVLVTSGIRYEGDVDVRLEYIYNGFGYDENQWQLGIMTGLLNNPVGLELPKRHYLYLSLRSEKLGWKPDILRIALRYLHSLQDGSGALLLPIECFFSDHFTAFLQPTLTHGAQISEFGMASQYLFLAGIRYAL